jgi:DNA-directed RNA polymerase sigma subunit (sigma70/sigma32)
LTHDADNGVKPTVAGDGIADEFDLERVAAALEALAETDDRSDHPQRSLDLTGLEHAEVERRARRTRPVASPQLPMGAARRGARSAGPLHKAGKPIPAAEASRRGGTCEAVERGSIAAKDRFMLSNIRLVISIATAHQCRGLELEDLVQAGMIGLNRAIEKYDWRRGYKFSTYATWWIRQSIQREIDNSARLVRLPVHIGEQVRQVRRVIGRLVGRSGREPSVDSIAKASGLYPVERSTCCYGWRANPCRLTNA